MSLKEEFNRKANNISYKTHIQSLGSFSLDDLLIMAIDDLYKENEKLRAEINRKIKENDNAR